MSKPRVVICEEVDPVAVGSDTNPTAIVISPEVILHVEFDYGDHVEAENQLHRAYEQALASLRGLST